VNGDVIKVSLEEFLRTGVFGPVEFGMTGEEILAAFGPPDTVFTRRRSRRPTGFEYGDVEFYLVGATDDRLCTINLNHFDVPRGSGLLALDPWCLRGAMPRPEAEAALAQAGISSLPTAMPDPSMDGIVTPLGVTLGFIREDEEFSPPAGLYSIGRDLRAQMTA
jgi:hypothetical protein